MTLPDLTSWSLIYRATDGRRESREVFARRYSGVIQAYFGARWRLPIEHELVQEASQEVFVDLFKPGGALSRAEQGLGSFRAYLYGVARRIAWSIERREARRREGVRSDALRLAGGSEQSLSRAFDRAWAKAVVRDAADLARERVRGNERRTLGLRALELRTGGGLPPREIAATLNVDVNLVYELLRRAKQDVRAAFLDVMAATNPEASEAELKQRCADIARDL